MLRAALYARFSSENQRDSSIEDQLRQCRERADRGGDLFRPRHFRLFHDPRRYPVFACRCTRWVAST
jgi:hypothetical protein